MDEQNEITDGKFHQKVLIEIIEQWKCLQKNWSLKHLHNYIETKHKAHLRNLCRSNWNWKINGRWQFRKCLTLPCTKKSPRENSCFWRQRILKSSNFYCLEPRFHPSCTDIVDARNTLIQERHNYSGGGFTIKVSRSTQKVEIHLAN